MVIAEAECPLPAADGKILMRDCYLSLRPGDRILTAGETYVFLRHEVSWSGSPLQMVRALDGMEFVMTAAHHALSGFRILKREV